MIMFNDTPKTAGRVLENTVNGYFHLWYIPMLIGIYMVIPILYCMIGHKRVTWYFLLLSFVIVFCIPEINTIANDFFHGKIVFVINLMSIFVDKLQVRMIFGYVFYFILGHELHTCEISSRSRRVIYAVGGLSFAFTIVLNSIASLKICQACETYFGNFTVNVMMETVSVFVFAKYHLNKERVINRLVCCLAKYSYGAYLVHMFYLEGLCSLNINTSTFHVMLSVPLIVCAVTIASFGTSCVLSKVPVVNKWLV